MATAGRPTKLTPETQARIIKVLEAGGLREDACRANDVDTRTFRLWMHLGRKPDAKLIYRDFYRAVVRAESFAANFYLDVVKRSADRIEETVKETVTPIPGGVQKKREVTQRHVLDPESAKWWLERMRPHQFGKRAVEEVVALEAEVAELKAILDALKARVIVDAVTTPKQLPPPEGSPGGAA